MARVALVTYDLPTAGGRSSRGGSFFMHWARLLRQAGQEVTLFLAHLEPEPPPVDLVWRGRYRQWGCELVQLAAAGPSERRWPHLPTLELSERVAEEIADFDVAYFQDRANLALIALRRKRFGGRGPVSVTVLQGPGEWIRAGDFTRPDGPEAFNQEFMERYAGGHSDWIVSPGRFLPDWLRSRGWKLPPERTRMPGPPPLTGGAGPGKRPSGRIDHLICLGGSRLLVDALRRFASAEPEKARSVRRLTLIGPAIRDASPLLQAAGYAMEQISEFDTEARREYLEANAEGGLVLMTDGRHANFPYPLLEAWRAGIGLLCCRADGAGEILGPAGEHCLADPAPEAIAGLLAASLAAPENCRLAAYNPDAANHAWIEFHEMALAALRPVVPVRTSRPSLDVCITYYNKPDEFPQLLDALDRQTGRAFHVIAVDDGSPDPEARYLFDRMRARHASRGWTFFRQENAFVDAARNNAARKGCGEYLLFIDADDVLPLNAVERLLECIRLSGDDCLVPATYSFMGSESPMDPRGNLCTPAYRRYMPLGPALASALVAPEVLGGPMVIVRRSAFETIGGYRELRGAAHEDWELLLRLALSGYRTDVVPEYLHLYRVGKPNNLSQVADPRVAAARLLDSFEERLRTIGLGGAAEMLSGTYTELVRLRGVSHDWARDAMRNAGEVGEIPPLLAPLRTWYRSRVSLERRQKMHRRWIGWLLRWIKGRQA